MDFNIWVTLTTEASVDLLISGLVRKGYVVGPLASDNSLFIKGDLSTLISLKLTKKLDDKDPLKIVMKDITSVLIDADRTFHSTVVAASGGSFTWRGSNIKLPQVPVKTAYERLTDDVEEVPDNEEEGNG